MPRHVDLDSITVEKMRFQGVPDSIQDMFPPHYVGKAYFLDPKGTGDNYFANIYRNDTLLGNYFSWFTDAGTYVISGDGKQGIDMFYLPSNTNKGDKITVDLWTTELHLLKYFSSVFSNRYNSNTIAPANPVGNLSGGALGYFAAVSVSTKNLILK